MTRTNWSQSNVLAKNKNRRRTAGKSEECAEASGYASVDEFVLHTIEKEIKRLSPGQGGTTESREKVTKRLQGLGYIE